MQREEVKSLILIVLHDLRNELASLATWAATLGRVDRSARERDEALAAIARALAIAGRLCEDLGEIATASGAPIFRPAPVDLREVVAGGVNTLRADARAKGVYVVPILAASPVVVCGDCVRLGQIVSNLVRNALAFTERGGAIAVEVAQVDGRAMFSVTDTGAGIPETFLSKVFDKFERASATRGGSGLGLYIVKALVDLHEGEVTVESAGAGKGARFVVTLPAAPSRSE